MRAISNAELERRIRRAVDQARIMRKTFHGRTAELAEALLLQGILAGDVHAAAITARLRLHNENLRLRSRIGRSRLATDLLKQAILRAEAPSSKKLHLSHDEFVAKVKEIYSIR